MPISEAKGTSLMQFRSLMLAVAVAPAAAFHAFAPMRGCQTIRMAAEKLVIWDCDGCLVRVHLALLHDNTRWQFSPLSLS